MDMQKVRRLVMLQQTVKMLEAQAKEIKKKATELEDDVMKIFEQEGIQNVNVAMLEEERDALEREVLNDFMNNGIDRIKLSDKLCVYVRSQLWASAAKDENGDADYAKACAALVAAGLDDFVEERFNSNTLSAYVRELTKDDKPLPESFDGAITITEKYNVVTRKA